jgi:hypothetical protein
VPIHSFDCCSQAKMQLASHGAWASARAMPQRLQRGRSLHSASFLRVPHPPIHTQTTAQRVWSQARNFVSRFVTQLTAPTPLRPTTLSSVDPFFRAANGKAAIKQSLSFPVRTALSRPLGGPFLPRPPQIPRSTIQVGLGYARNFSSSRPIFQNLAENVPIATRAFWEADWEIKMREEREKMLQKPKIHKAKKSHRKLSLQPRNQDRILKSVTFEEADHESDLQQYFDSPASAQVTTVLLVPLAPTPTSRAPLPSNPPSHEPILLPLSVLATMHSDYTAHSHRVSTLFARLDLAYVWNKGVTATAYSQGQAQQGVCTILRVEFDGWTKKDVQRVIGESGEDWCVLKEVLKQNSIVKDWSETSSMLSDFSGSEPQERDDEARLQGLPDPTSSFIMPTLDLSAFHDVSRPETPFTSSPSSPRSSVGLVELHEHDISPGANLVDSNSDGWSDVSDSSGESALWIDPPSSSTSAAPRGSAVFGVMFSSDFTSRLRGREEYEPSESPF